MQEKRSKGDSAYLKPELIVHDNLKDITYECPNWQCSVVVPSPPQGP
jgi:hypothetical protein